MLEEFIRDLKRRGLDGSKVKLGIMDGLAGLEKVFQEEFYNAKTQRCQVHVAKNVLAKVTKNIRRKWQTIFVQFSTHPRKKRQLSFMINSGMTGRKNFRLR